RSSSVGRVGQISPSRPHLRVRLAVWFAEKYRDAIWIGIIKTVLLDAHRFQPALDLFRRMLPSILWMIPVKIDHIVRFQIECVIPEAFDEIVVNEPLNVVRAGGNAEDLDRLLQRDGRGQPSQLASHFGSCPTFFQTSFRRQLAKFSSNVVVADLPGCAHFFVKVKEKLASWAELAIQRADCGFGIWRVVKNAIRNDEIKQLVLERGIHQIGANDGTIGKIACLLERHVCCVRNVDGKDLPLAMFGYEASIETRSRPHLEHIVPMRIEAGQIVLLTESKLASIPSKEKILLSLGVAIVLKV